ncbi:hypothetical protein [Acetobacter sp.]|uniref:hypothetical protein n=1 Tax=Acetobacter sp. TaxID=440 RepID=UPI0025C53853|nr:hypothetical protein [Acetobacter sp.]MCH4092605.1 hypothetical protein [Acetobacter sp.]MCI1299739.1 hypothetical protein [Acetobacter sp.]MCI1315381.1 hypothetical protein [Acetobacter sp.]
MKGLYVKTALSLLTLTALWFATPAMADETLTSAAESSVANEQLRKELAVLQADPEQASEACINAMKELRDTQAKISAAEERSSSADLTVAKDVLESDYENAIEMCGPDARRLCMAQDRPAKLTQPCTVLKNETD